MSILRNILRRPPKQKELFGSFTSLEQWREWLAAHPEVTDSRYIRGIVKRAQRRGCESAFLGPIPAREVALHGTNYREELLARGLNPRLRAMLDLLAKLPQAADIWNATIYAPEALTPFALVLRGRYARFVGSEYVETDENRRRLFPIQFQDLSKLEFPAAAFEVVVSNEVFEHIPDLPRGLREIARVLKPGGVLLATFPFAYQSERTIVKAWFSQDGQLQYDGEAEYHGNPVDPKGSLVFQVPAWDVVDTCRGAGFRDVAMEFISSVPRGITGTEICGIFVLRAVR
jgi:SAM-dependent methyltransferase